MGFSLEWDDIYAQKKHYSIWPWSDLISLFNRFVKNSNKDDVLRVFELGCGVGYRSQP